MTDLQERDAGVAAGTGSLSFVSYYCPSCGEGSAVTVDVTTTTLGQFAALAKRHHILHRQNPSCEGVVLEVYVEAPWPSDLTKEQADASIAAWAKRVYPDSQSL